MTCYNHNAIKMWFTWPRWPNEVAENRLAIPVHLQDIRCPVSVYLYYIASILYYVTMSEIYKTDFLINGGEI